METLKSKLSSRKLWAAVAGVVMGLAMVFGLEEDLITTVAGSVVSLASIVSYIVTEGIVDAEGVSIVLAAAETAMASLAAENAAEGAEDAEVPAVTAVAEAVEEAAEAAVLVAAETAEAAALVGNTATGKYHAADCRYAAQILAERRVSLGSAAEAEAAGFAPCNVCLGATEEAGDAGEP